MEKLQLIEIINSEANSLYEKVSELTDREDYEMENYQKLEKLISTLSDFCD